MYYALILNAKKLFYSASLSFLLCLKVQKFSWLRIQNVVIYLFPRYNLLVRRRIFLSP